MGKIWKRIMKRSVYESGKYRQSAQDSSREFITLIAYISALGKVIPLTLLYKGSRDLQDSWVEDIEPDNVGYFGSTANG
jgi:hypothetical protein